MTPRFLLSLALPVLLAAPLTSCGAADAADVGEASDATDRTETAGPAYAAEPADASEAADAPDAGDAAVPGVAATECHPSYPDYCIPPPPPDLNCPDIRGKKPFRVRGADPHRFDRDRDGWACEPNPRRRQS